MLGQGKCENTQNNNSNKKAQTLTNNKNSKRQKMLQHKRLPTEAGGLAYLVKVLATKHGSLSSIPHGGRRELILHAVL